ncbi:MAG: DUF2887 domain-containing protein [Scytonema sp. PMC 1070.18]|nr:DUF2887 domain-containing protein [Scytonema sp. PMC 1070.18]
MFFVEVQFQYDEALYYRFFTESMMYLNRNRFKFDGWYCVVIFPERDLEPSDTKIHQVFLNSNQVQRIYLDELGNPDVQPIGISLMQLTIASEQVMAQQARQLIERVKCTQTMRLALDEIIDIITTIAVYKYSRYTKRGSRNHVRTKFRANQDLSGR